MIIASHFGGDWFLGFLELSIVPLDKDGDNR
jgi:hypothetical protein